MRDEATMAVVVGTVVMEEEGTAMEAAVHREAVPADVHPAEAAVADLRQCRNQK